jgi:hypothetical protein
MAISSTQRMILTGLAIGVVVGLVVGALGAYLGLPAGVRGGLTGALVVVGLQVMRKKMNRGQSSEVRGQS